MEDLLEEIVGQIYDEYDRTEPAIEEAADSLILPGDTPVSDANEQYSFEMDEEEYQTIGGFVFGRLGRLPRLGDRVSVNGGMLMVLQMDGRRVSKLQLIPPPTSSDKESSG